MLFEEVEDWCRITRAADRSLAAASAPMRARPSSGSTTELRTDLLELLIMPVDRCDLHESYVRLAQRAPHFVAVGALIHRLVIVDACCL